MTLETALATTRANMQAKYPGFDTFAPAERRLLVMAYIADELKVREVGGNNRGEWVEVFLESVGLGEGSPWCAAAMTFASIAAQAPRPKRPTYNPAAVVGWQRWADDNDTLIDTTPRRGDIAMRRTSATTGHIGVVVKVVGPLVYSIEGNTSPGSEGSQADGGGLYRRVRSKSFWSWGFARV